MMTKEGSTKIVNVMTPRVGVQMLGRGHKSHYIKYVLSSTLTIYLILIAIVLRIMMLLSYTIVDFYLFYDGAVDKQYKPF